MNNKMKKFNKILMMTVAILLTLVLASTSVVSGIFAKYVITKSATTEVSLKAFGVTLKVEGVSDLPAGVTVNPATSNDNTLKVEVTGLSLVPGQNVDKVVKFTITEQSDGANVPKIKLKIKTTVSGVSSFDVTTAKLQTITPDTSVDIGSLNYIPFTFVMTSGTSATGDSTAILSGWQTPTDDADLAADITTGIKNSTFGYTATTSTTDTVEKIILDRDNTTAANKISTINVKYLTFGFRCLSGGNTNISTKVTPDEADLIQTYLSQNNSTAKFKVIYTVSLEQA